MDHKIRALVRVDLTCSSATIHVTGCFTTVNYRALVPVIRRARALPTHPVITVDVSQAKHLEPQAVRLLEEACRFFLPRGDIMNSGLAPSESFPDDLAALTDVDPQVLHIRIQCQLDHDHAHDVGANFGTVSRHAGICDEIEQREFSTSTGEPPVRLTAGH